MGPIEVAEGLKKIAEAHRYCPSNMSLAYKEKSHQIEDCPLLKEYMRAVMHILVHGK